MRDILALWVEPIPATFTSLVFAGFGKISEVAGFHDVGWTFCKKAPQAI